ncbi:uncharacterized protein LOC117340428 [Pecten maximus]|uniref:uncharacterized protein LOC117340428 n=1 Tax=Pecten maximus TaxID=6579 RepID=UPI001457FFAD|nr:uncharacterized protein LOC117340428 [Pecten maximus]
MATSQSGCARHDGAGMSYVCLDCDEELICRECRDDLHKGHNLHDVSEVLTRKREIIRQYLDSLSLTDQSEDSVEDTEWKLRENSRTFRSLVERIRKQGEVMKGAIDTIIDRLVKVCAEIEKHNAALLETYKASQHMECRTPGVEICEKLITSGTNEEVMRVAKTCQSRSFPGKTKMVDFRIKPLVTAHLQHMLGKLTVDGLDHEYQLTNTCTILSQFQHVSTASTCRAIGDEQAWLSHWADDVIYRVDQQGHVKESVHCGVKVRQMALCPGTGRVWFCCWDDCTIREILDRPETRIVTDQSPMSLCVTADSTVVVGVAGDVRLYTKDGRTISSGEIPCRQSAMTPHHLACCPQTGDIAVADNDGVVYDEYVSKSGTGGKRPHIKVMDKHLNVRFCYPDIDRRGDIHQLLRYPYDVCFDARGDVLVADWATHSVLQVDGGRGHFLRTVYTGDAAPHTVSLQRSGVLWVGLVGRTVRVLKYREEHDEG